MHIMQYYHSVIGYIWAEFVQCSVETRYQNTKEQMVPAGGLEPPRS